MLDKWLDIWGKTQGRSQFRAKSSRVQDWAQRLTRQLYCIYYFYSWTLSICAGSFFSSSTETSFLRQQWWERACCKTNCWAYSQFFSFIFFLWFWLFRWQFLQGWGSSTGAAYLKKANKWGTMQPALTVAGNSTVGLGLCGAAKRRLCLNAAWMQLLTP